jgi:hypothetical protein
MEMDRKLPLWVKQLLIYGTGIGKLTWKQASKKLTKMERSFDKEGNIVIEKPITTLKDTYDGPDFSVPEIQNVYPEPNTKYPSYVTEEYEINKTLLYKNKNYKNEDIDKLTASKAIDKPQQSQIDENKSEVEVNKADDYTTKVNIKEHWTDDRLIVVANDTVVLRDEVNPYGEVPYVFIIDQEDPEDFWGIGEVEPNIGAQNALNTVERQIIDANALRLKRPGLYNKQADIDTDELERGWSAGNLIGYTPGARGEKPIEFLDVPDISSAATDQTLRMQQYIESTTAANDYAQGSSSNALNKTAKGAEIITEMASDRFRQKLSNVEMGISDLGEKLLRYNTKFVTKSQKIKVLGESGESEWVDVSPKDLNDNFKVSVEANSSLPVNKRDKKNEFMSFFEVAIQFPDKFNMDAILEDFAKEFGKEPKRYMVAKEQIEGQMEVEQQMTEAEKEAEQENELMAGGRPQTVLPDDDHETHLVVHEEEKQVLPQDLIMQHIEGHKAYLSPRATEEMMPAIPGMEGGPQPTAATDSQSMPTGGEVMSPEEMAQLTGAMGGQTPPQAQNSMGGNTNEIGGVQQ